MDVKILVMSCPIKLEKKIYDAINVYGYRLVGPVTTGVNQNGTTTYVGTLLKEGS